MAKRHCVLPRRFSRTSRLQKLEQLETRTLMAADVFAAYSMVEHTGTEELHFDTLPLPSAELLLAGTIAGSASASTSGLSALALTAIPALNSLPGAKATVFLDFDGHSETNWGSFASASVPVYDTDGDATTFSTAELNNIQQIWQQVAEDYAPFNINVTTVLPTSFANGVALRVAIGGDGAWSGPPSGGISYINSFTNSVANTAWVFSKNLANGYSKYVADATSHEAGHAFGLEHQSSYAGGTKTEYYAGTGDGRAPIMGNSYSATRGVWWVGTPSSSSTATQNDVSVLSRTANGFGYRADDFGNTASTASPLTISNNTFIVSGVLGQTTDLDFFSFNTGGGQASFAVNPITFGNNLDAKLELRDAVGTLIVAASPTTSFGATIATTLAAGAYRLVVASNGLNGDIGQYTLSGTVTPAAAVTVAAPSNLSAAATSTSAANLSWTDNSSNEQGFRVESSTDNQTWTTRVSVGANVTSAQVTGLSAGTTYYFRVIATAGTVNSAASDSAATTTWQLPPATPTLLTATAASSSQINLSWTDVASETGYKIERSTDGSTWSQVATTGADVTSYANTGLAAGTVYYYRVKATGAGGDSAASAVVSRATLTVSNIPVAPSNLTATAVSTSQVNLSWRDNATNETGYRIEYSMNNSTWTSLGTVGANVTAVQVTGTAASRTYYFRVKALNSYGVSAASNAVGVTTPAASLPVRTAAVETGTSQTASSSGGATTGTATAGASTIDNRFATPSGRWTTAARHAFEDIDWLESLLADRFGHRRN